MEHKFSEFSEIRESDKSLDPVSQMCLARAVVASWSLTQKDARFEPFYCVDKYFVTVFRETLAKTQMSYDKVQK